MLDVRVRNTSASPVAVATVFTGLGGKRGWPGSDALWRLRGLMDSWIGGVGLRRGRRSATALRLGDAVDFWRVDAYESGRLLRLRAEMKLPGRAWLQFEVEANSQGSVIRQTAIFDPAGLAGLLYWYMLYPVHRWIFAGMLNEIAAVAGRRTRTSSLGA